MFCLKRYKKENFESFIKRYKKINIKNIKIIKKDKDKLLKNIV